MVAEIVNKLLEIQLSIQVFVPRFHNFLQGENESMSCTRSTCSRTRV